MDLFQATQKEYVSPIDLTTLNTTYTTLEKGHQDAVKAKSQLQEAIAQLDLNPEEDQFRANLVNQLRQTVADNTVFGNEYGALDDIVRMSGDIISSPEVLGRLRAQTNYKAFVDDVNARTDLPDDYKQYFLNYSDANGTNKYHYEDKYDNNGNIIGGSEWKPVIRPTAVIDLEKAIESAVKLAAADVTSVNNIQYYDANDERATYGSGYYYMTENGTIEKLSEDKIRKALDSVIESTPGLKESLRQDYDVTKWYYDNLSETEKSDRNNKYVADCTNSDGSVLSFDEYLEKRTKGGIEAASYERDHINKSLTELKQNQAIAKQSLASSGNDDISGVGALRLEGSPGVPIASTIDYGNQVMVGLQTSFDKLNDLTNQYWGHKLRRADNKREFNLLECPTFDNMLKSSSFKNLTEEQQLEYKHLIDEYNQWKDNYYAIRDKLSTNEAKDEFDFVTSVYTGKVNTKTKNGKAIVDHINDMRTHDGTTYDYLYINYDNLSEKSRNAIDKSSKFSDKVSARGHSNGVKYLELEAVDIDDYIALCLLTESEIEDNINLFNGEGYIHSDITTKSKEKIYSDPNIRYAQTSTIPGKTNKMVYNTIKYAGYGVTKSYNGKPSNVNLNVTYQNQNTGWRTWTEIQDAEDANIFGTGNSDLYKELEDSFIRSMATADLSQLTIYGFSNNDNKVFRLLSSNEVENNLKADGQFSYAIHKNNNVQASAAVVDGLGIGLNISYTDKDDKEHKFFILNAGNQSIVDKINNSLSMKVNNQLGQMSFTQQQITLIGASAGCSALGVQKLKGGENGMYVYTCGDKKYNITRKEATNIMGSLLTLQEMYDMKSKISQYSTEEKNKALQMVNIIATTLHSAMANSDTTISDLRSRICSDLGLTNNSENN